MGTARGGIRNYARNAPRAVDRHPRRSRWSSLGSEQSPALTIIVIPFQPNRPVELQGPDAGTFETDGEGSPLYRFVTESALWMPRYGVTIGFPPRNSLRYGGDVLQLLPYPLVAAAMSPLWRWRRRRHLSKSPWLP
jgi:hypothetical protein